MNPLIIGVGLKQFFGSVTLAVSEAPFCHSLAVEPAVAGGCFMIHPLES
jgi:hypothetical protein